MEYQTLTETTFFQYINTQSSGEVDLQVLQNAYNDFVTSVVNLCQSAEIGNNANIAIVNFDFIKIIIWLIKNIYLLI